MKRLFPFLLVLALSIALPRAEAVTCYAINEGNMLLRFDSATPGTTTSTAITGLPVGYRVVGIDFRITAQAGSTRPGIGSLWALATDAAQAKLFVIAPGTGAATFVGNIALPALMLAGGANGWFFGFDPGSDTIRILNFFYNYQIDPQTLTATAQTQFNEATNPNNFPALNGSAYFPAPLGGPSVIYFLEQGNEGMNLSSNISTGVYTARPMPMNISFSQPAGLDFGPSGMLAAFFNTNGGVNKAQLFSASIAGAFTLIGDISATPATLSVRALAIQPSSFPTPLPVTVSISGKKKITTTKKSLTIKGTATSGAGITLVQVKAGKGGFKPATGTTAWSFKAKKLKPGTNKIQVQATGGNGVVSTVATIKVIVKKPTP